MSSAKRKLLLLSSSTLHGTEYLQYAVREVTDFLKKHEVSEVLFIPYALRDHDAYTRKVQHPFEKMGFKIVSIHTFPDPAKAVHGAEAVFIGGGNTFQLLKKLYDHNLIEPLRKKVLNDGTPYIGSSAGTNVATTSICTTNDMPIVYPPSFTALQLVPFNINPHYIDADPDSKHMGETREERISQYHEIPGVPPVLGLREGCILYVEGKKAVLQGCNGAKLFIPLL
ncbi:alpha-aspartyl dipeptidase isoform X2 [Anabrus simplex]|uniref:alpha-aspartyl dipeptidase isoform X2 n=1 Tax=Anabrus simplex TaxID=316456 RepID=UPI0034DD48A5